MDQKLVGRTYVDRLTATCISCNQPFKFGVNMFTPNGQHEVAISGMCEKCFDELFDN